MKELDHLLKIYLKIQKELKFCMIVGKIQQR
jgi:hypothetical protein